MTPRLVVHQPRDTPEFHALVRLLSRSFGEDEIGYWAYAHRWAASVVQFSDFDGESCIANVGAMQMQIRIAGRDHCIGGIHAVATDPDHRGRGLFAELMGRALEHLASKCETVMLFTRTPSLYERWNFRVVHDDVYVLRGAARHADSTKPPIVRHLDLSAGFDAATLGRLLKVRTPVSDFFGPLGCPPWFWGNTHRPAIQVSLLTEFNAAVVYSGDGGYLRLLDVIGKTLPPIDAVLRAFAPVASRVELWFTPDLFVELDCEVVPRRDGDFLMVRGPLAIEGQPFAFPPTAYF